MAALTPLALIIPFMDFSSLPSFLKSSVILGGLCNVNMAVFMISYLLFCLLTLYLMIRSVLPHLLPTTKLFCDLLPCGFNNNSFTRPSGKHHNIFTLINKFIVLFLLLVFFSVNCNVQVNVLSTASVLSLIFVSFYRSGGTVKAD